MVELLKAIRLMGLAHMLKLKRGYQLGWEEMLRGYFSTHTLHALLNVGFIDELRANGAVRPADFAEARNLDAHILEAACAALYETEFFDKRDGAYELAEKGRLIIETLQGWLKVSYGYSEIFGSLEPLLRKEKVYGKDFYRRSDFVAVGSGEMEDVLFFPVAVDMLREGGYRKVLDLGCGDGTFLRKLCKAMPDLQALGVDLAPAAVEEGKLRAEAEGLSDRLELIAQDISTLRETPEALRGVEAATVFFVLHELLYTSEQRVIDFLQDYRRIFPGAPLIVFEAIRPSPERMRRRQGVSIYYFLYHDLSHQKPTDRAKWRELFARAGFTHVEERFLGFAATSIFTLR